MADLIPESEMAATRLELRWRKLEVEEDGHNWKCDYNLVVALEPGDIRSLDRESNRVCESLTLTGLGGTRVRMGEGRTPLDMKNGDIYLPYRDGAHICFDSKKLGDLPRYVVFGGWAMPIPERDE